MLQLKSLILDVAQEDDLGEVEQTLKWSEPSFSVKGGSPVRIDWKAKTPEKYYVFFNCQTKLVDTFRELYSEVLKFEGNRAIVLDVSKPLPVSVIKHCIELAFKYKLLKHLPLLGA